MSKRKAETANVPEEDRRRLSHLIDTAISAADEYRARGNHARAREMDELAAALRDLEARNAEGGKHSLQRDVEEFHRALDIPVASTPAIRRPELRAELIREEAAETVEAIERGDLVGAVDGMCDLFCVVYGTAAEFGIDLAPFWDEVHRTNLAKKGGPVREDGKRLKPPGWKPPDIAGILARGEGANGEERASGSTPCDERKAQVPISS